MIHMMPFWPLNCPPAAGLKLALQDSVSIWMRRGRIPSTATPRSISRLATRSLDGVGPGVGVWAICVVWVRMRIICP